MPKTHIKSKSGFTIIEVVLVLAIAGLIFLMVFIAFPALQRAQHDTQRTDDMARVQAQLLQWQNNHSNNLPSPPTGDDSIEFNASDGSNVDQETGEITAKCSSNRACQFVKDYMNAAATVETDGKSYDTFKDPSGEYYNIIITKNISGSSSTLPSVTFQNAVTDASASLDGDVQDGITIEGTVDAYAMFIIPGATCKEDMAVKSSKNNFAILYRMEGSGIKCTNNGS